MTERKVMYNDKMNVLWKRVVIDQILMTSMLI